MESEVESGVESEAMGPEDASTCTYVLNVDDSEGTPTASLEDNGEELAVDGAKGRVPCVARDADTIVALVASYTRTTQHGG